MCFIGTSVPEINYENALKVCEFIGKNVLDYKEFNSLIEKALDDRLNQLKDYCEKTNSNYNKKLRDMCSIEEQDYGYYTIILPSFMNIIDIKNNNEYYKLFLESMNKLI